MQRHNSVRRGAMVLTFCTLGAVALAGCHPKQIHGQFSFGPPAGPITVPANLDCPVEAGDLSRTAQASDGKSCAYSGPHGQTVQLSLMGLDGQVPQARLAALEQTLKGQLGPMDAGAGVHVAADGDRDNANIDLPGFHLHANGDKAEIQIPGVSIDSDGDKAQVDTGFGAHRATVNANGGGAEVRTGSVRGGAADLTYVLATSRPGPTGLRAAGYIARGPAVGPLVVGVFRTPQADQGHELNDGGLDRLMRLNTGRG